MRGIAWRIRSAAPAVRMMDGVALVSMISIRPLSASPPPVRCSRTPDAAGLRRRCPGWWLANDASQKRRSEVVR
jgi:hypothetical protein